MIPAEILEKYWGFSDFKGSQSQIIGAVLQGHDVLALLPTAGGKSVCYQVPAMAMEGLCIVISPLIALIHDQVASLKKKGIKAIALAGGLTSEEIITLLDNCQFGNYKFLYLSPERLQQPLVQERLPQLQVNLIAIDEAHCISQWGNDFRPAYLNCSILRDIKPGVPVIALTATATREVADAILENLHLRDCLVFKDSFFRSNIAYRVVHAEDKSYRVAQWCKRHKTSGIIYVRTRRLAEELAGMLAKKGIAARFFHGGLSGKDKKTSLEEWMKHTAGVMVATNAFGMGVDKEDVRWVLHYQIPDCIENYFQEAGRAGRDGQAAQALLLVNPADEMQVRRQFMGGFPDISYLKKFYKTLSNYFQIPYGTGEQTHFNFHFHKFCEIYGLNGTLAYNSLTLLDQYSVIALSQNFKRKTKVQFAASKPELWNYLEKHPARATLIKTLLRSYGGIFDFETKINTFLLAKKAGVPEEVVLDLLEALAKDDIIRYQAEHGDLDITFLVPREDDLTINRFSREVVKNQEVKAKKLEQMLQYAGDDRHCRARQLLNYFGEDLAKDCGICDTCLGKLPLTAAQMREVEMEVLQLLKEQAWSSSNLVSCLEFEESSVLKALQLLLEKGKIKITSTNEYILNRR